jgi:hypothetical protein
VLVHRREHVADREVEAERDLGRAGAGVEVAVDDARDHRAAGTAAQPDPVGQPVLRGGPDEADDQPVTFRIGERQAGGP